jgi:hypothetical protein
MAPCWSVRTISKRKGRATLYAPPDPGIGERSLPRSCLQPGFLAMEAGMSIPRPTDYFSNFSVGGTGVGDFVTEQAPDPLYRSHSETGDVEQTLICARIIEVLSGQQTDLGGDYIFEQLPVRNDQIVLNRRRSYDIMRVLYSAREPETTVYVRWVARRKAITSPKSRGFRSWLSIPAGARKSSRPEGGPMLPALLVNA